MTHFDTTFLVDLLREAAAGDEGPALKALGRLGEVEVAVSVHATCELYAGAALADDPAAELAKVDLLLLPIQVVYPDDAFPLRYGEVLAELRRRGEMVPTMDLLIATAALVQGARLVTRNARDFDRVPGLHVVGY